MSKKDKEEKESVWSGYSKKEKKELEELNAGYRDFLTTCKTERESVIEAVRQAEAQATATFQTTSPKARPSSLATRFMPST